MSMLHEIILDSRSLPTRETLTLEIYTTQQGSIFFTYISAITEFEQNIQFPSALRGEIKHRQLMLSWPVSY